MNTTLFKRNIWKHKITNLLHSFALLAGMGSLLGLLGWFFAGPAGISWAIILTVASLMISARWSPRIILRWYAATALSPRTAPALYSTVGQLAKQAGLPKMPTLYYVPTRVPNAFTTGSRSNAVIAVTEGLLKSLKHRELTGVIAHEIGHLQNNDLWLMNLSDTISRVTALLALIGQCLLFLSLPLLLASGLHVSWAVLLLLMLAPAAASLLQLALSRSREFDADLAAAALTGDPAGLAAALSKMERLRQGWLKRLFLPGRRASQPSVLRSHPETRERVERLLALAAEPHFQQPAPSIATRTMDASAPPVHLRRRHPRWHFGGIGTG